MTESSASEQVVLFILKEVGAGRLSCSRLQELSMITAGLLDVLERLRRNGQVHYELLDGEQMPNDDTIIALCTPIRFGDSYKLVVMAPDQAPLREGEPTWQILVYGTPDSRLAEQGFYYWDVQPALLYWCVIPDLSNSGAINSTVLEEALPEIMAELEVICEEYEDRKKQLKESQAQPN